MNAFHLLACLSFLGLVACLGSTSPQEQVTPDTTHKIWCQGPNTRLVQYSIGKPHQDSTVLIFTNKDNKRQVVQVGITTTCSVEEL